MRLALGIEYIGHSYNGWQKQEDVNSVEEEVIKAISLVADHPIKIYCAGRTDKGVHALGQVIHFESNASRSINDWKRGVNHFLPDDIAVLWVSEVNQDFHARYDAISRTYNYYIDTSKNPSIFRKNLCWHIPSNISIDFMQEAANIFIGTHDFSSFRARKCQAKSPIKTIYNFDIIKHEHLIIINICANSFLYNMVRNLVAAIVAVASGNKDMLWLQQVFDNKARGYVLDKAPAGGLYFMCADYNEDCKIPKQIVNYSLF
jgi:tRNA pseudouridine38-40 synthase